MQLVSGDIPPRAVCWLNADGGLQTRFYFTTRAFVSYCLVQDPPEVVFQVLKLSTLKERYKIAYSKHNIDDNQQTE
jgi:hypothetical protein